MQLIIDDGAVMRTSRQVIFNPYYTLTGIATCVHKTRTMMTSILYTDYYKLNGKGKERVADLVKQRPINPKVQILLEGMKQSPIVSG